MAHRLKPEARSVDTGTMDRIGRVDILLVEDNPDHADFTLRALKQDTGVRAHWVKDGEEALDFLQRSAPRPALILLDIHLPKLNGHGVLRHVKSDDAFRSIPVVMLTTSEHPDEMDAAYDGGANSFVTKSVQPGAFVEQVKTLKEYWTRTCELPAA